MSRGAGRIEQAIEAAFAVEGVCYKTDDLCKLVYPDTTIERKHRVSVMRAVKKVCERTDWEMWDVETRGKPSVFVNPCDLISYAIGRSLREHPWRFHRITFDDAKKEYSVGSKNHRLIEEGGSYYRFVQMNIAKRDGDVHTYEKLEKEMKEAQASFTASLRLAA